MQALVGREGEIEAASTFLDRLEAGPAVLLFAGEPGIGKTTLWTAAVEQARDRGFLVLSARGVEAEGELGYAALADLLEPIAEDMLPELPEPQRRALAIALLVEDPGQRRIDLRAVGAATTTILRRLSQEAAVVLAVDDLQWLDRPS